MSATVKVETKPTTNSVTTTEITETTIKTDSTKASGTGDTPELSMEAAKADLAEKLSLHAEEKKHPF